VEAAAGLAEEIAARLDGGQHVILHCGAGIGRAGTMAILTLMTLGHSAPDAAAAVGAARPMAGPEAGPQRDLVVAYAARLRSRGSIPP
jgi:protein-tyrosine phosphatase